MQKIVDRIFGGLLIFGACGHTAGTVTLLPAMSGLWVWSMGSASAAALLGVLNVLRAGKPVDTTLAVVTTVGTACWAVVAWAFGVSIGNVLDPRAIFHLIVSVVLVCFGIATIRHGRVSSELEPRTERVRV